MQPTYTLAEVTAILQDYYGQSEAHGSVTVEVHAGKFTRIRQEVTSKPTDERQYRLKVD
jgi:hypothetical protein